MIARLREVWARLQRTRLLRAWNRYNDLRGNRLAGAVTFYGFISLFPLLVLAAAVASAIAGPDGIETVQDLVDENLPGVKVEVQTFFDNAGTIGVIGAATLLITGLGWVDATRAAVRSMWGIEDQPGNVVVRKAGDFAALAALGVLLAVSWGVSVVIGGLTEEVLEFVGIGGGFGRAVLWVVGAVVSVAVSAAMFAFLLAGLPRIPMGTGNLVIAAISGAAVFEVLKQFLVGFVVGTAAQSTYAAFAAPLALLAWIYLVTRLLMFLAALTAETAVDALAADENPVSEQTDDDETRVNPHGHAAVAFTPTARQARNAGVAAGATLGAAGLALALIVARAARDLFRRPRSE